MTTKQVLIVGGAVYRFALQAPKKDAFEQFQPKLERWHDVTNKIKQNLWILFYSNPLKAESALRKFMKNADVVVPDSQRFDDLEKWIDSVGKIGMSLVDLEQAGNKTVEQAAKWVQHLKIFSKSFHQEAEKTKDPAYQKLAETVDSFIKDLSTPMG